MGALEGGTELLERTAQRRGGEDDELGLSRSLGDEGGRGGRGQDGEQANAAESSAPQDAPPLFPIITSVDLMTAYTASPSLSPIRSAERRVMMDTSD